MSGGTKSDEGKLPFDLLPVRPLEQLVAAYQVGADKYGPNSWRRGIVFSLVFAAMMRHAWAWWRGEKFDLEDGQHHLASVASSALILIELERTAPGCDDRAEPEAAAR